MGVGDRGSGPRPEKSQNKGFLSNTGPDPLNNHKATKQVFNVGPSWARQQNAIYGKGADGSLLLLFGIGEHYFSDIQNKEKKTLSEFDSLWQNFLNPCMRRE